MGLKIFFSCLAILGIWVMWHSVTGKKEEVEDSFFGNRFSFFEVLIDLTEKKIPLILLRRIFNFIIGLFLAIVSIIGVIYS
ncbi:hypothetical protein [Bacillus sp. CECT 9360]|uniref:hypothetical protein n=1 Tax=Bacillus sp. CECT 9360 TaxID=2845821 RepID=UPI001E3BD080|nr:hypothetical protein [Bacillus sp. CECT 9360]CAH0346636.1 hypothetical protein BCI9360_02979 [Bacillus sp. CECT 9360]